MRPSLVAALCVLAALAGAGGVLFAVENGGWAKGGIPDGPRPRAARTLVDPAHRRRLEAGAGTRLQAAADLCVERASGVVTIYSYFGAKPGSSTLQEGSGFVVDRTGILLTAAHVIASSDGSSPLPAPARAVYVQFNDGDRVAAQVIGWDPYDDVGVLRVSPCRAQARAGAARKLRRRPRRPAGRRDRHAVRRLRVALGRGRLGNRPDDPVAHDRLRPLRRDPDRRADQRRQLGRAAARRGGRRDRDQRPDPLEPRVGLRGRGVRRSDRLGEAVARPSCSPRATSRTRTSACRPRI